MRIIAGELRGRRISAPRGMAVRPTSDRVREALFSLLEARHGIDGGVVLDLFAGSGALGLEALSRGASRAVLVDRARRCCRSIADNARRLGVEQRVRIVCAPARAALERLQRDAERFDLALLDPPYAHGDAAWPLIDKLATGGLLRADALVVVEHRRSVTPPTGCADLAVERSRAYGDTTLTLYAHATTKPEEQQP